MLTREQIETINLITTGEYTVTEVMKMVGKERTTYYWWMNNNPEFVAELNAAQQRMKKQIERDFTSRLPRAIEEYWKICISDKDTRTKEKALQYWIDRSLGKISTATDNDGEQEEDFEIENILESLKADSEKELA